MKHFVKHDNPATSSESYLATSLFGFATFGEKEAIWPNFFSDEGFQHFETMNDVSKHSIKTNASSLFSYFGKPASDYIKMS